MLNCKTWVKQDGGAFLELLPMTLIFLFKVYFVTFVFALLVCNMSAVTVQQLISILDEKLALFSVKMNEVVRSIEFINTKYEEMETKLTSYEAKQKDLCNENQALALQLKQTTKELNDLKDVCNDLEQYSRRDCVEIRGVPLKRGLRSGEENTDRIVMKVAATVGVEIEEKDISISHRLKTSESYRGDKLQPPPIIVKFTRRVTKENFYKAQKKLYNDNVTAKVLGYESDNKIFVVESLTGKNKDLFHKSAWG
jgi:hypothetical protein